MSPVFIQPCDGASGEGALYGAGGCASPEPVLKLFLGQTVLAWGRYAENGQCYSTVKVFGARSRTGVENGRVRSWHTT